MKNCNYILELKNVSKRLNNEIIFSNINLKIKKGEVISIIGESGVGKTTLLKCINKLLDIDEGTIYFNNKNIKDLDLIESRTKIGLVFQEYNLFENLNVFENLMIGLLKIKKMDRKTAESKVDSILHYLKLKNKKFNYPKELSGGQKQRVAIARTLLMKPDIMLLDEPTSALDKEMKDSVLNIIKEIVNEDMTLIIVSHEDEFIKKISDNIYQLKNNKLQKM